MAYAPVNATGWEYLFQGQLVKATFTMYDLSLVGFFLVILFVVTQFMLYMKTKSATICFTTGIMFLATLFSTQQLGIVDVKPITYQVIFLVLAFELGYIIYHWFFIKD